MHAHLRGATEAQRRAAVALRTREKPWRRHAQLHGRLRNLFQEPPERKDAVAHRTAGALAHAWQAHRAARALAHAGACAQNKKRSFPNQNWYHEMADGPVNGLPCSI